jgi:hypothetical protein
MVQPPKGFRLISQKKMSGLTKVSPESVGGGRLPFSLYRHGGRNYFSFCSPKMTNSRGASIGDSGMALVFQESDDFQ